MTDRLALVRQHHLRDLVDELDQALETLEFYNFDDGNTTEVEQRDLFRVECALEAAADYLHALRLAAHR
jgi:hypothetical protein